MKLTIAHLYADLMNIYGDRGNILCLYQRCLWRGIEARTLPVGLGEELPWLEADIIFIGGGQDRDQHLVSNDLMVGKGKAIHEAGESGSVLLAICGGYQLLGHFFKTADGRTLSGVGLFDAYTIAGPKRMIGNIVVRCSWINDKHTLVGFENHSGQTYLGPGTKPLGRVLLGHGNNGQDGTEGAIYNNTFGCYLHGSLLPKNPWFADLLILTALRRRYGDRVELEPLADGLEWQAHEAFINRSRSPRNPLSSLFVR